MVDSDLAETGTLVKSGFIGVCGKDDCYGLASRLAYVLQTGFDQFAAQSLMLFIWADMHPTDAPHADGEQFLRKGG